MDQAENQDQTAQKPESGPVKPLNGKTRKILSALEENWQAEMTGFYTYRAMAQREQEESRKKTLNHLADAEIQHAALWAKRIRELGGPKPVYGGEQTGEADCLANRVGGPELALRRLEIEESRDIAKYGEQLRSLGDEPSVAILKQVIEDEKEHYLELSSLIRARYPNRRKEPGADPKSLLDDLLAKRDEGRAKAGDWIGDAIYGINDGLGAIFGIVSGVSGATVGNSRFVLLAGLAGMVASALSMGSGAYLAAKSKLEIYEAEVERDRRAIEFNGAEARELLALYYQVKGLPEIDAHNMVEHIARNPDQLLKALSGERLNVSEEGLSNPWTSALSGSLSTAIGAFIPIVPFFFLSGYPAIIWAAIISLLAHFAVGASKSLITVRSWWSSGMEMTLVGAVEGVVTYVIGIGLGHIG